MNSGIDVIRILCYSNTLPLNVIGLVIQLSLGKYSLNPLGAELICGLVAHCYSLESLLPKAVPSTLALRDSLLFLAQLLEIPSQDNLRCLLCIVKLLRRLHDTIGKSRHYKWIVFRKDAWEFHPDLEDNNPLKNMKIE